MSPRFYVTLLALGLCLSLSFVSPGQIVDFEFYTTEDGLSNNRVWGITQDATGLLWVSTDALNRFDGRKFSNYNQHNDEIFQRLKGTVKVVSVKSSIAFVESGVLRLQDVRSGEYTEIPLDEYLATGLLIKENSLFKYKQDQILIPLFDRQAEELLLLRYHDGRVDEFQRITDIHADFDALTLQLCSDSSGNIYYIQEGLKAIVKRDSAGKFAGAIPVPAFTTVTQLAIDRRLSEPLIMVNGKMYSGSFRSMSLVDHPVNGYLQHDSTMNQFFAETVSGDLWITGPDRYLAYYDATNDQFEEFRDELVGVIEHRTNLGNIFIDRSGVAWIKTIFGLLKAQRSKRLFRADYTDPLEECGGRCSFRGITSDDKGTVYASFYNNIFEIPTKGQSRAKGIIPEQRSPFGLVLHEGSLLMNDGLVFDPWSNTVSNKYQSNGGPNDIGVFAQNNANIWWGFKNGIYQIVKGEWQIVLELPEGDLINFIEYDSKRNALWIAVRGKLMTVNVNANQLQAETLATYNLDGVSRYIHIDSEHTLWLGTQQGLLHFDPDKNLTAQYTIEDGLCSNYVVGILPEGDSCLWLSTHNGLSRFQKERKTFINFYVEDGIADNEFNRMSCHMTEDGRYFFGGIGGLTSFEPGGLMNEYLSGQAVGELAITNVIKTDSKQQESVVSLFNTEERTLPIRYENKTFSIEFAYTDYRHSDRVLYSYQLEGYNEIWTTPSNVNVASFNALPDGEYTLNVRAINNIGGSRHHQLEIPIKVYPPWWNTYMAYIVYLLILLSIGYAILRFYRKRWKLQLDLAFEQQEANRLKELDAFKSKVYANITHEFRTPLTVILGMTKEIIETGQQNTIQRAELIEKNGKRMLSLVNQLLDLSKLQNQSFKLQYEKIEVIAFLRYVTESFQTYANGQNLSLRFMTTEREMEMDIDKEQIQQVMTNLISNAVKFTPSGGEIRVEVSREGDFAQVRVEDSGIGMPEEDLPYIFDRFFQAGNARNVNAEGTGIGLAHAYELVKLMKGTLTVESQLNRGSCFTLKLPISTNAAPGELPTEHVVTTQAHGSTNQQIENGTINAPLVLIIEDNADVVLYLKGCLQGMYRTEVAFNGKIGIEKALELVPDLIVSDVMMPEANGFEVCDTLKKDVRTSHIPIVLLTAKADSESRISGLRYGADAYLTKPFDKAELLVRLEKLNELRNNLKRHFAGENVVSDDIESAVGERIQAEDVFMKRVIELIEERYQDTDFAPPVLCRELGMSRSQLYRKLSALSDTTPSLLVRSIRLKHGMELLKTTDLNISEIAYDVGFSDPAYFSRTFASEFGYPPSEVRPK